MLLVMNYIKQLQNENQKLKTQLGVINNQIDCFINFLHGAKFTGVQSDGSRKDWISTGDVIHSLREIKFQTLGE